MKNETIDKKRLCKRHGEKLVKMFDFNHGIMHVCPKQKCGYSVDDNGERMKKKNKGKQN